MCTSPLDELIDKLGGPDKVAEMTGRKGRMVRRWPHSKPVYEQRATQAAQGALENLNVKEVSNHKAVTLESIVGELVFGLVGHCGRMLCYILGRSHSGCVTLRAWSVTLWVCHILGVISHILDVICHILIVTLSGCDLSHSRHHIPGAPCHILDLSHSACFRLWA